MGSADYHRGQEFHWWFIQRRVEGPRFPSLVLYTDEVFPLDGIIIGLCLAMRWSGQVGLIFEVAYTLNHPQTLEICECYLNTCCLMSAIRNSLYASTYY